MPLKFKFKTRDEIPTDVLGHYVERDGAWVLDVEGAVDRSRVDEFRANNVELMKQFDELKARFNGIDLEETKALKESILTRHLIEAARSKQVRKSAMDDFLGRARNVFKLVNGVPTALDADGKTVRYGKDGVTPMTLEENLRFLRSLSVRNLPLHPNSR